MNDFVKQMRIYELLEEYPLLENRLHSKELIVHINNDKYYTKDNVKDFDTSKLQDIVGVQISSIGISGVVIVYAIIKSGEEIIFNCSSLYYLEDTYIIDTLSNFLPSPESTNDNWKFISNQFGWSFWLRKDYTKEFYKECKKYAKTNYKHLIKRRIPTSKIVDHFVLQYDGPNVLLKTIKEQ